MSDRIRGFELIPCTPENRFVRLEVSLHTKHDTIFDFCWSLTRIQSEGRHHGPLPIELTMESCIDKYAQCVFLPEYFCQSLSLVQT
jgi:hypothetical protein